MKPIPTRVFLFSFVIATACGSHRISGNTRTKPVRSLDANTFQLTEFSADKTYGFDRKNPICVGSEGSGPQNERRYLNALLGPKGEPVSYTREGSCCSFKTPNGLFDDTGLLDRYKITWEDAADTLILYINMYDKGDLKIPVGFTARKGQ